MANFDQLLEASRHQSQPQRLLLLFAKATPLENSVQTKHQSGIIEPIMCVDKLPAEIASFESLVLEADAISNKWDFIFISSLSGAGGVPPTSQDAESHLSKMTNNLASGKDVSSYIVLDRSQRQVTLG